MNVAHLMPLSRRLSRSGLVDALTAHYGSPGQLADYRRQFERTTRTVGKDATALETLAVKAFGDMGQTARLRLIRDWFIAGHSSCELRRLLDSVPPRDCRVWENHADPAVRRVSKPSPDSTYPAYVFTWSQGCWTGHVDSTPTHRTSTGHIDTIPTGHVDITPTHGTSHQPTGPRLATSTPYQPVGDHGGCNMSTPRPPPTLPTCLEMCAPLRRAPQENRQGYRTAARYSGSTTSR